MERDKALAILQEALSTIAKAHAWPLDTRFWLNGVLYEYISNNPEEECIRRVPS